MKTTIKKYLVVVMMLGTLINYANETSTNVINGKRVRVEFKTVKKGQTLSIKNENGNIMFSQKIENSGDYSRIFDLSYLKKGSYTAELEKDYEIIVKDFTVLEGEISFENEKTIFKPVIRKEDNLIFLSKINFDKKPMEVEIYYQDEIIFSETVLESKSILNRIYKMSKSEKGDYKVIIRSDKKLYIQDFKI